MNLGAIQTNRAQLQNAHLARHQQHLHKQLFDLKQKPPPERRNRGVIVGMAILAENEKTVLHRVTAGLRDEIGQLMLAGSTDRSPLAQLPVEKRAIHEHLFELVYSCSTNRTAAKALIDRILLKIA